MVEILIDLLFFPDLDNPINNSKRLILIECPNANFNAEMTENKTDYFR